MTIRDPNIANVGFAVSSLETGIQSAQSSINTVQGSVTSLNSLGGLQSFSNYGTSNIFNVSSSHIGKMVYSTSNLTGSANNVIVRVQPNISPYVGAHFHVLQYGDGKIEIRAGSGVTVRGTTGISMNNAGQVIYIRQIYGSATVINISTNNWVVVGDISAA